MPEVGKADAAGQVVTVFSVVIDQEEGVFPRLVGDVGILTQLDVTVGTEDEGAPVTPGGEAVGGKPVDAKVVGGAVVRYEGGLAKVFQLWMAGMGVVGDRGVDNGGGTRGAEGEKLLDLVAADVGDDPP